MVNSPSRTKGSRSSGCKNSKMILHHLSVHRIFIISFNSHWNMSDPFSWVNSDWFCHEWVVKCISLLTFTMFPVAFEFSTIINKLPCVTIHGITNLVFLNILINIETSSLCSNSNPFNCIHGWNLEPFFHGILINTPSSNRCWVTIESITKMMVFVVEATNSYFCTGRNSSNPSISVTLFAFRLGFFGFEFTLSNYAADEKQANKEI